MILKKYFWKYNFENNAALLTLHWKSIEIKPIKKFTWSKYTRISGNQVTDLSELLPGKEHHVEGILKSGFWVLLLIYNRKSYCKKHDFFLKNGTWGWPVWCPISYIGPKGACPESRRGDCVAAVRSDFAKLPSLLEETILWKSHSGRSENWIIIYILSLHCAALMLRGRKSTLQIQMSSKRSK